MVRNRHVVAERITEVSFAAPVGTPAGVEVMSLAELRSRARPGALTAPTRPAFHHLLTLSSGVLEHTVDFTGYTLEPGSWLWVRPGQVEQWHDLSRAEGTLILFEADFLDPATAESAALHDPFAPVMRTAGGEELAALHLATGHLRREFDRAQGLPPDVHVAVLRHLLAALLLRLAYLPGPAGIRDGESAGVFLRFRDAVERDFASMRRGGGLRQDARVLAAHPLPGDDDLGRRRREGLHRPPGDPRGQATAGAQRPVRRADRRPNWASPAPATSASSSASAPARARSSSAPRCAVSVPGPR